MNRVEIGDIAYLWMRNSTRAEAVVISAHGDSVAAINARAMEPGRWMPPLLHYYSPHGYILPDPGIFNLGKSRSIPALERIRADKSYDYSLSKYTNTKENPIFKHNKAGESYRSITTFLTNPAYSGSQILDSALSDYDRYFDVDVPGVDRADIMASISRDAHVAMEGPYIRDILTIRNRATVQSVKLSKLLSLLYSAGYTYSDIHCSFCRGPKPAVGDTRS